MVSHGHDPHRSTACCPDRGAVGGVVAAWRGVRRDRRILGSVRGVSEMSRDVSSQKFLDKRDSEVNIRSDHIHVDTVDMDTYLLAEIKDQQLARLERASREPGHPSAEHNDVRTAQPALVLGCPSRMASSRCIVVTGV